MDESVVEYLNGLNEVDADFLLEKALQEGHIDGVYYTYTDSYKVYSAMREMIRNIVLCGQKITLDALKFVHHEYSRKLKGVGRMH